MEIVPEKIPPEELKKVHTVRVRRYEWHFYGRPGVLTRIVLVVLGVGFVILLFFAMFWLGVVALVLGLAALLVQLVRGLFHPQS